jgi:hypothetical protein
LAGAVERRENAGDLRVGERDGGSRGFLEVEACEFEIGARALDLGLSGGFEKRAGTSVFAVETFGEAEGGEQAGITLAADVGSDQGEARIVKVPKMRAMTIAGLCLHIGVTHETWCQYRKRDEEFSEVTAMIDSIIRTQKFEGAAADLFNANIISRDLGLVDRQARDLDIGTKDSLSAIIDGLAQQSFTLASES